MSSIRKGIAFVFEFLKWCAIPLGYLYLGLILLCAVLHTIGLWEPAVHNFGEKLLPKGEFVVVVLIPAFLILMAHTIYHFHEDIAERLRVFHDEVRNLATPLFTLEECLKDLRKDILTSTVASPTTTIRHLGLDMGEAWERIAPLLADIPVKRIDYQLLMLSEKGKNGDPPQVTNWRKGCDGRRDDIIAQIKEMSAQFEREGRELRFMIKTYEDVPVMHGVSVDGPLSRSCVTQCRWTGAKFDQYKWGNDKYHRIDGNPLDPESQDQLEVFTGYFYHLWNANATSATINLPLSNQTAGQPPVAVAQTTAAAHAQPHS